MEISKALGFGIFLHVLLIAALLVQPSCINMEAPTQTYRQSKTLNPSESGDLTSGGGSGLFDSDFNSGIAVDSDERFAPTRPDAEFSEFDGVTPKLSPIISDRDSSTVEVAGPSFKIHTVQKGDSLWAISRRYSVSLDDLYAANGLNKSSLLKIGQQIKIPSEGSTATINTITADTYQPSSFNMDTVTYTVVKGDSLFKIARRFNATVSTIKAANNKKSDLILAGEKLIIPVDSKTSDNKKAVLATTGGSSVSTSIPSEGSEFHVVKVGEYPGTIARQYGMTASELLAINGIRDPRKIKPGQKLKINPKERTSANEPKAQAGPIASQTKEINPTDAPVAIRVLPVNPLIESEPKKVDPDSMFENAEEIPVVPMEE